MKVVFDTNTLISAAIRKGKPNKLLIRAIAGEFTLVTSNKLLGELNEVIFRPRFELSKSEVEKFISAVKKTVKIAKVKSKFKVIKEDPDDDLVINTAYDSKSTFIVSGDKHLLRLKGFKGIKIVNAGEMLEILRIKE